MHGIKSRAQYTVIAILVSCMLDAAVVARRVVAVKAKAKADVEYR